MPAHGYHGGMLATAMPRKGTKGLPGLAQCNIRMPQRQLERLDAIVTKRNEAAGYDKTNRTELIREAVEEWLAHQPEGAPQR